MSIDRGAHRNSAFKRGIVRENDPAEGRSRVEFGDEDGVASFWLSWNMPAAGGSKVYNAPDIGAQVHCLVDRDGSDGCILGASYSQADRPPVSNGSLFHAAMEGGGTFSYDKGSGALTLNLPGGLTIEAAAVTIRGPVTIEGAALTHNGKDVGSTHGHVTAPPGPPGPPV